MLFIDVSNVLHTTGVLPPDLAGLDLDGLVRLLAHSRYRRRRVVLVCDGVPPRRHAAATGGDKHVQVLYSGAKAEADDVLIERLKQTPHAHGRTRALVVSSDRRLKAEAQRRGLLVRSSAEFLAELVSDHEHEPVRRRARERVQRPEFARQIPLPALEVAHWAGVLLGRQRSSEIELEPGEEARLRELLGRVGNCAARHIEPGLRPGLNGVEGGRRERMKAKGNPGAGAGAERAGVGKVMIDADLAKLLKEFGMELSAADLLAIEDGLK
jgi:predicted RNA-binding protein with PIN domain